MLFSEIVERLSKGLDPSRLSDVLKFDCGQDGVVTLGPNGVGTVDQ
ncbi:MAG: sterol carrier protein, partial [Marivivens sp.]|nr:sterol carrier protein [Marivivens sp.]